MTLVLTTAGKSACASGGLLGQLAYLAILTTGAGSLLVEHPLGSPMTLAESNGVITGGGTLPTTTPAANGTAAVCQLRNSSHASLGAGTVTATGGGGDVTMNNTAVVTTSNVTLGSMSVTIN